MKEIKQNKNSSAIRFFSFACALVVLLVSISIPSFAATNPASLNGIDFTNQPVPSYSGSPSYESIYNLGLPAGTASNGNSYHIASHDGDVYVFYYVASGTPGFLASSETQGAGFQYIVYNGSSFAANGFNCNNYDSNSGLYWGMVTINDTLTYIDIPQFNDRGAGRVAVRNWIDNPPSPLTDPHPISFNLNPGYVAFVDISDLTGVSSSFSTTTFGGAEWSPRITDQSLGVVSSLPSSFSLPISGTSSISWTGTGSKNVLGQYKEFAYSYSASVSGTNYLCIVNPLQAKQGAQLTAMASMPSARNNPIAVTVNSARSVKVYSLTASLAVGSGTLDTSSNGDTWSGEYDNDTSQWNYSNDQTGESTDIGSLPVGGGNDPIIGETSINDWLQEIANSIKGFFSGAIGAVTTLVSSGSDFIHSLSGLYAWLPGPVYSVLVSALILVITIGVIKVFI